MIRYCVDVNGRRFAFTTLDRAHAMAAREKANGNTVSEVYERQAIDLLREQFPEKFSD